MTIINGSGEFEVNSSTSGDQRAPSIAKLDDGYVVAWQSFNGHNDLYLQRYTDAGAKVGAELIVNTTTLGEQAQAAITAASGGGFVVSWASDQDSSGADYGVFFQRFDSQANRLGGETQVNTSHALNQQFPAVATLANGGFIVTWFSDNAGIYTRVYGADGSAVSGEMRVNTASAGPQSMPSTAGLADGGYLVAWDGTDGIHAQRFDSHGAALSADARIDTGGGAIAKPVVAALVDGGYVVAWQSVAADGNGLDVHAQRFGADGSVGGAQSIVNGTLLGHQTSPAITAMPDGGYVVAWTSTDQDGSGDGVFAQRFAADGHAQGQETQLNIATAHNQSDVAITNGIGGYLATWASQEADGSGWDVFATAIRSNNVPPQRSIIPATEGSDHLVGTWDDNACLALGGDDVYLSQGGSDYFDGGTGLDKFVFPDSVSRVTSFTLQDGTLTVYTSDMHNARAVPIILATERIEFSDALFALDTKGPSGDTPAGHVWQAAALLQAAFGHAPDQSLLSRWTAQADASSSMAVLGDKMIAAYAAGVSSTELVTQLYVNVTGQAPTQSQVANFVSQIGAGKQFATQGDLFAYAASQSMNTDHIAHIVGSVQQLDASWFTAG